MPGAATIQPAILARGLRRVALERGVTIHEGTQAVELDGERPGWLGAVGAGSRRAAAGRAGRPVRVRTTSAAGDGEVIAGSAVVGAQRLGGGVAVVRSSARDVVEQHGPDRADPGPARGHRLDRRRGSRRRAVHAALPAADPRRPDRHRRRRRPGRVRRPDRRDVHRRCGRRGPRRGRTAPPLPVAGGRPDRGRLGRSDRHLRGPPAVGRVRAGTPDPLRARLLGQWRRAIAGRRAAAGRDGAGRPQRRRREALPADPLAPPVLVGGRSRAFPPEPLRYLGARVVREAIVRREAVEERGEPVSPVLREVTRLPRRMGYHLSPD